MIQKVEFINESGGSSSLQGIEEIQGKNLILMTQEKIEQLLLKRNPGLASIVAQRIFPQTIRIIVKTQDPVAFFMLSPTRYLLFAPNGTVLRYQYERPEKLGEITYYQVVTKNDYDIGSPIRLRDMRFAVQLADAYTKHGFTDFLIQIQDTHLIESTLGNATIRASSESDATKQLSSIERVLYMLQRGGQKIQVVDVRFEKMIIEQ